MPVPSYSELMLPILSALAPGDPRQLRQILEGLIEHFRLTHEDLAERVADGGQTQLYNRTNWALTYLAKAGLVTRPKRAHAQITSDGRALLARKPEAITTAMLREYESLREFEARKNSGAASAELRDSRPRADGFDAGTPDELVETAFRSLRESLVDEILERIGACIPAFFEELVVKAPVAMGYWGSLEDVQPGVGHVHRRSAPERRVGARVREPRTQAG